MSSISARNNSALSSIHNILSRNASEIEILNELLANQDLIQECAATSIDQDLNK